MQTSSHHAAGFEALAQAYVRRRLPDALPIDIANAVQALRDRIDSGELQIEAVVSRLWLEPSPSLPKASMSFGDIARACRDLDGGRLTPRERAFVKEMVSRGFSHQPSARQAAWLRALFDRLSRRAAA